MRTRLGIRGSTSVEYLLLTGALALGGTIAFATLGEAVEHTLVGGEPVSSSTGGVGRFPSEEVGGRASALSDPTAMDPARAAGILLEAFAGIDGGDGVLDRERLVELAGDASVPADVRAAAGYLVEHEPARHMLDVGAGRGDVDGRISRDDLAGALAALSEHGWDGSTEGVVGEVDTLQEADRVVARYHDLFDTAAGRGGADGEIGRRDLEALAQADGVPAEVSAAAALILELRPPDEGCSGFSLCQLGRAASWVGDRAGEVGGGAGWLWNQVLHPAGAGLDTTVWETGVLLYEVARFVDGLAHGDPERWLTVGRAVHGAVTDPRGAADNAWAVGSAVVAGFGEQLGRCVGSNRSVAGCSRTVGEFIPDIAVAVLTGGTATAATRGGRVAATVARHADEVADAARVVDRAADGVAGARGARGAPAAARSVLTASPRERMLEIMTRGSLEVSRTKRISRRFMAPASVTDDAVPMLAERNFRRAAEVVIDEADTLPLSRETATRLNRMVTDGLVPDEVRGQLAYRRDPSDFYDWLESSEARALGARDPVALADEIHFELSRLDAFPDGNGRTARLMADLALVQHGRAPALYTHMDDYFLRGNPRSPATRAETRAYWREIADAGQAHLDDPTLVLPPAAPPRPTRPWPLRWLH